MTSVPLQSSRPDAKDTSVCNQNTANRTPQALPEWELYHALREQWTHEDNPVNRWLVYGFPIFGMAVAAVIGISIFAALDSSRAIEGAYRQAGLERLCHLVPQSATGHRGNWAAKALPSVFATLWLLAATGLIQAN